MACANRSCRVCKHRLIASAATLNRSTSWPGSQSLLGQLENRQAIGYIFDQSDTESWLKLCTATTCSRRSAPRAPARMRPATTVRAYRFGTEDWRGSGSCS